MGEVGVIEQGLLSLERGIAMTTVLVQKGLN
jgi:hypothetical protein